MVEILVRPRDSGTDPGSLTIADPELLFDVANDPGEKINLAADPRVAEILREETGLDPRADEFAGLAAQYLPTP